ncbi:MAG: hypothetical protein EXS18_07500 [Verrucomicrobiae bacterium]|nr:hypothetical protein [Verrucomicrobiae bacterium]
MADHRDRDADAERPKHRLVTANDGAGRSDGRGLGAQTRWLDRGDGGFSSALPVVQCAVGTGARRRGGSVAMRWRRRTHAKPSLMITSPMNQPWRHPFRRIPELCSCPERFLLNNHGMKTHNAFLVSILTSFHCMVAESDLPSIFVAPLDGDVSQIQGWQPALGEGLAEMLITELTKLNKFQVLESTAIENLKDEIRLGEDGYVADKEKVEKGGWAGADFMFRGKVTRFGSKSQGLDLGGFVPGSGGKLGVGVTKSDVRIDWRFTDVANRKIITTGSAVGT